MKQEGERGGGGLLNPKPETLKSKSKCVCVCVCVFLWALGSL